MIGSSLLLSVTTFAYCFAHFFTFPESYFASARCFSPAALRESRRCSCRLPRSFSGGRNRTRWVTATLPFPICTNPSCSQRGPSCCSTSSWSSRPASACWECSPPCFAFLAMAYASFSHSVDSKIQPLLPALKSNWLIAHVVTCFFGYAAFAISCGLSVLYLLRAGRTDNPHPKGVATIMPNVRQLDEFNYQMILFGFLWLSLGIITGSIWANSAWGTYWSWDPKETWSLITWFMYAALLHSRNMQGWRGSRVAWLSLIGFGCVLFTYFGVNFLLSGLHSYATK